MPGLSSHTEAHPPSLHTHLHTFAALQRAVVAYNTDCMACRNYEDAYSDPGSPASRRTSLGTYVLAMVDGQKKLLMQGHMLGPLYMVYHVFVATGLH